MLEKSIGYLQEAAKDLRLLSHRLAPEADEDLRMLEKINELINRMNVKANLNVTIDIEDAFHKADPKLQLVVYRIIQEQFTNILKYSKASTALLKIVHDNEKLTLIIKDNGIGFDTSKKASGIGLMNIKARASLFNGEVTIRSSPGQGFELSVIMKLK